MAKKLVLKKETVSNLSRFQRMEIRAGGPFPPDTGNTAYTCVDYCTVGSTCTVGGICTEGQCDSMIGCTTIPVLC